MKLTLVILLLIAIVLSIPIIAILFFLNKKNRIINRLLSLAFFGICCNALRDLLFLTGWSECVQGYLQVITPIYYLIPPCIYIYIIQSPVFRRATVKIHWVHFIPAIIIFFNIVTKLILDNPIGSQTIHSSNTNPFLHHMASYLPEWIVVFARPIQGFIYVLLQFNYLYKVRILHQNRLRSIRYQKFFEWIFAFTIMEMMSFISISAAVVNNIFDSSATSSIDTNIMLLSILFLIAVCYLFLTPNVLYGYEVNKKQAIRYLQFGTSAYADSFIAHERKNIETDYTCRQQTKSLEWPVYTEEMIETYHRRLEKNIKNEIFRNKGLTTTQLAKASDIPVRALNFILKNKYNKGFKQYINELRIAYVIKQFKNNDWRGRSLEGLALEAGFSSRTTFYVSFKKSFDLSPTEYLETVK